MVTRLSHLGTARLLEFLYFFLSSRSFLYYLLTSKVEGKSHACMIIFLYNLPFSFSWKLIRFFLSIEVQEFYQYMPGYVSHWLCLKLSKPLEFADTGLSLTQNMFFYYDLSSIHSFSSFWKQSFRLHIPNPLSFLFICLFIMICLFVLLLCHWGYFFQWIFHWMSTMTLILLNFQSDNQGLVYLQSISFTLHFDLLRILTVFSWCAVAVFSGRSV